MHWPCFYCRSPSFRAGAAITIFSTKFKTRPSKASYFPKVKFGTIALLILRHTVESTTVGCDNISGWEADERLAIGRSLTRLLRSDVLSSRRQAQFSEQCSAQHGLDLNKDDMGVSALMALVSCTICRALETGQQMRPFTLSVVPVACGYVLPPSAQIARISFSFRRV
jgi:hypothetical protein